MALIPWDNSCMDRRTIITLGSILVLIIAGFSFLIFNPSAKKAMQKNLESSVQDAADQTINADPKKQ